MTTRESIERTDIRSPNPTMVEAAQAATPAATAPIRVVVGYYRTVKVRVSGRGIRNG